jgi:DNA polymerase III sliding clamp (beta) subunit (PCNA family)
MEFKVHRDSFIQKLESVQYGLSRREVVDQCSCFAFRNGWVYTFNDEVTCKTKSLLPKEFSAAVPAYPLLAMLKKWKEEEVAVRVGDGEVTFVGKNRKSSHNVEKEIFLPIDKLERPEAWRPVPSNFGTAISLVQETASQDEKTTILTSLHFTDGFVESTDQIQITRFEIETGIEKPYTVRRASIKDIVSLDMTETAETPAWVHFRNPVGVYFSCRRYVEEFPKLDKFLADDGGVTTLLPKGIVEAAEKAMEFSKENIDDPSVEVSMRAGLLRIRGKGVSGSFEEVKKVAYDGPPIKFRIPPQILSEIAKRHSEVRISPTKLRVEGMGFVYCASLQPSLDQKGE